jgi:hypothetical protein
MSERKTLADIEPLFSYALRCRSILAGLPIFEKAAVLDLLVVLMKADAQRTAATTQPLNHQAPHVPELADEHYKQ